MRLTVRDRVIDCTDRTAIMAILNVATDSRVAHSVVDVSEATARARAQRDAGADIIDVGAHSTRTGAREVSAHEEIDRLCPVIEALRAEAMIVSVDTWSPDVARAAALAGADILNDVTAAADPAMAAVAAEHGLPIIVMHMRGRPKHHRAADQRYANIGEEVQTFLADRITALEAVGVRDVWLDPGFQFGKTTADNVRMLLQLPRILELGRPLVISASRKGFLAELLGHEYGQNVPGLLHASIAFNTLTAYLGTHIVRVHDVAEVAAALRVVNGIRAQSRRDRSTGQ